jgi:Periplasmic binding protein
MAGDRRRLRGAERRLLKGYAPLVVLVAALVVMVAVVPSKVPADLAAAGRGEATEVSTGQPATGWNETVTACTDRPVQVPDLGYSPPCFAFAGDNGGATARGVTADTIRVSYRVTSDPNLLLLLGQLGGVPLDESNEEMYQTMAALVEWVNANFQLYGRKIELVRYDGRGQILPEFTGGGQDAATNDSIKVANEIGAFADVTGITQPYADALARNEVVAVGAPYMSREWFEAHRPFAWSIVPDCTITAEGSAIYANGRLFGRTADHAGDDLADQERTLAVIAPNNLEYQQCVDTFEAQIGAAGNEVALRLSYTLDPAQLKTQAASLMAKLKDEGTTSVSCACDPVMQMYLGQEATAIGYYPEWLIAGVGFIDWDLGGQIISKNAPDQWVRAFGGSPSAAPPPPERSVAHAAYRSVRDGEPSLLVQDLFHQLLLLALGIQMAGPNLTPETFETGLFSWPGGTGQAGAWDFGPGHYTPITDIREIWWDPVTVSAFNGEAGTYRDNGQRYVQQDVPEGEPEVFP